MRTEDAEEIAFAFGPFRLIPRRQVLIRGREPLRLGARALDILHLLLTRAGEEVSKDALIEFAWPNVFVDQANLKVHISSLRRVLEDSSPQPTYIATIPGHGYRFVANVRKEAIEAKAYKFNDLPNPSPLPAPPTLVGRKRDLQAIGRALDFANLITLVGPGGVGKSSLAIAVAHAKRKKYPDGIHFVDLVGSHDSTLVPHLIATSVGMRTDASDFVPSLRRHLQDKRVLIVIDNCEHMLHAVASILSQLAQGPTWGRILTTSREPLGLSTEHVQRIEPLGFPNPKDLINASDALSYPAVELFAYRALESSGYRIVDQDIGAIASLCKILDGLPLAIEIAAAKLEQFSPAELFVSLSGHLDTLSHRANSVHSRHHTLWKTLDWSYRLLSAEESMLFRLLSVFAGSFEWTEVARMARLPQYIPYTTTLALGGLVAKSLISADLDGGEQLRYRLLISARDFASEHLKNSPFSQEAHRQHAMIVLSTLEKAETEWSWVENHVWRARYFDKAVDLRKALDWCFGAGGDPPLGISLAIVGIRLWNEQSSAVDLLTQVDRALLHCATLPEESKRKAQLASSRAWGLLHARRLLSEADDAWNTALEASVLSGEKDALIAVDCGRVIFLTYTGRSDQAIDVLDHLLSIAEGSDDRALQFDEARLRAFVRFHLGCLLDVRLRLEQLANELQQGVPPSPAASRYGLQRYVSVLTTLAFTNWLTGRPRRALKSIQELLVKTGDARALIGQAHVLALFAMPLAFWSGDIDALERYSKMFMDLQHLENIPLWEPVQRFYEHVARQARGENNVEEIRLAVSDLIRDNFLFRTPMYLGVLAEILLKVNQHSEAQSTIESALAMQQRLKEEWCLPELLRIKANILYALGVRARANAVYQEALEKAEEQGNALFVVRITNNLAEHAIRDGECARALSMLETLSPLNIGDEESATEDLQRFGRLLGEARQLSPQRSTP